MTNQIKKNSLYRKLLTSSFDKDSFTKDLSRLNTKFEAKRDCKDETAFIFREFWEEEQRKKIDKDLKRTF